jgi:hypothetical protein
MTNAAPSLGLSNGAINPPRELGAADRANGVDPQPIQWSGVVNISFGLNRLLWCRGIFGKCNTGDEAWQNGRVERVGASLA